MMKALRRHKDWLMIVIAVLAIPFVFYFVQRPDYGAMRSDQFARMYDRNVSMLEAQQIARLLSLAQALGMSEFVQTLAGGSGLNQNQVAVQFIINLLVLRHEAGRLGLRPDGSEIADVVRKLPAFQSESGFDMNKFSEFVRNALGPMGLGEEHIEQLVRDELCLNEIKRLLAAGISISKGELDENFQRGYDKFYVNVVRFHSSDFDKDIKERQYVGQTWQQVVDEMLAHLPEKVFISFDIDGLDPKLCPHTGTPVQGGFEAEQVFYIFKKLIQSGRKFIGPAPSRTLT